MKKEIKIDQKERKKERKKERTKRKRENKFINRIRNWLKGITIKYIKKKDLRKKKEMN